MTMPVRAFTLAFLLAATPVTGSGRATAARVAANPIRKVVMMLQNMQKQVTEEGKKDQALYDKFMCYCETGVKDLEESIATAEAKIEALTAASKADLEEKAMTDQALKEHEQSRAEAKEAMAQATDIREKEAKAYGKFKADSDENLAALTKAT